MLILQQEPFRSLLDSHFCWIQPLFNFVYRPAFTRKYTVQKHTSFSDSTVQAI